MATHIPTPDLLRYEASLIERAADVVEQEALGLMAHVDELRKRARGLTDEADDLDDLDDLAQFAGSPPVPLREAS